jgi:hypothetical protein
MGIVKRKKEDPRDAEIAQLKAQVNELSIKLQLKGVELHTMSEQALGASNQVKNLAILNAGLVDLLAKKSVDAEIAALLKSASDNLRNTQCQDPAAVMAALAMVKANTQGAYISDRSRPPLTIEG